MGLRRWLLQTGLCRAQKLGPRLFVIGIILMLTVGVLHRLEQNKLDFQSALDTDKIAQDDQNVNYIHPDGEDGEMSKMGKEIEVLSKIVDKDCEIVLAPPDTIKEHAYKIYIYDLPSKFNTDLLDCLDKTDDHHCEKTSHCGMGPELYLDGDISVRDTWQFSLEVIIHHKLLVSPYRTRNASEASVFYIPYYSSAACLCYPIGRRDFKAIENVKEFYDFMNTHSYFINNRPHIMTLGKIEREQATHSCPLLKHKETKKIAFIGMEKEYNPNVRKYWEVKDFIVAPYPSYVHFKPGSEQNKPEDYLKEHRNILLLLAAGTRRSNPFRRLIFDQFPNQTTKSYPEFMKDANLPTNLYTAIPGTPPDPIFKNLQQNSVWLVTNECQGDHNQNTIQWMKHSVFCLQPPGDSPTRKSFYDAIQAGCIPMLFKTKYPVKYPFENQLDYDSFTITLPISERDRQIPSVLDLVKAIPRSEIHEKLQRVKEVARFLQYSYPITNGEHQDALQPILEEIKTEILYNL